MKFHFPVFKWRYDRIVGCAITPDVLGCPPARIRFIDHDAVRVDQQHIREDRQNQLKKTAILDQGGALVDRVQNIGLERAGAQLSGKRFERINNRLCSFNRQEFWRGEWNVNVIIGVTLEHEPFGRTLRGLAGCAARTRLNGIQVHGKDVPKDGWLLPNTFIVVNRVNVNTIRYECSVSEQKREKAHMTAKHGIQIADRHEPPQNVNNYSLKYSNKY